MTALQADPYALLEDSFTHPPQRPARTHDSRRSDSYRQYLPGSAPLQLLDDSQSDHDTASIAGSNQSTPLASPRIVNGGDNNGLPPTPPSVSKEGSATISLETHPNRNSMVGSIASQMSALSTPVNARSPPTPDPSPPRTAGSNSTAISSTLTVERPPLFPYPSSQAESFTTAREDLSSEPSNSRSSTPHVDRLSTVEEDRGLGLAFERDDSDATPTERPRLFYPSPPLGARQNETTHIKAGPDEEEEDYFPIVDKLPDREWNTELMKNVTVRRKHKTDSSPHSDEGSAHTAAAAASPAASTRSRRSSSLRERVKTSGHSPRSPSIETFAQAIGWPAEDQSVPAKVQLDTKDKRVSTASVTSTVVAAMVINTPPQRQKTLRHSAKNMALRKSTASPLSRVATLHSSRNSVVSEDVPLHRLVHKKAHLADMNKRFSTDSETLGALSSISTAPRNASPFSIRSSRTIDSSAYTLAHQESVRRILQPAADILSRSNSQRQPQTSPRMRISSAPEAPIQSSVPPQSRGMVEISPPQSPQIDPQPADSPIMPQQPPYTAHTSITNPRRRAVSDSSRASDLNKPLPRNPLEHVLDIAHRKLSVYDSETEDKAPPPALLDRVRLLVAEREAQDEVMASPKVIQTPTADQTPASPERRMSMPSPGQLSSPVRRGSRSSRGRSEEQRRSSHSQDRTSPFYDSHNRHSRDQTSPEAFSRRSYDWQRTTSDENRRISFDRSTGRTEEHANARHLYSQSTPFSQFSDTPIEVSEATAVSIYPHNNNSLLVVQQPSRVSSMVPELKQLADGDYFDTQDDVELRQEVLRTPTPPFVDAIEGPEGSPQAPLQPTLTFEPSTPPMQTDLLQPNGVDSPLKNPRSAPEPPKIMFIPPTPAEELERSLDVNPPGPPKHSDSHPQRRLSLVQRARRYSDNFISPFLARASSNRGRYYSESHARSQSSHRNPEVPTVSDEDGTLHPFWRPRGFWDGFEDSDSDEDNVLPSGGDTSDVEDPEPEPYEPYPRRKSTLRKRLTNGFQGSGGFLIGNSLGVERHGTNRRRHHVTLPPDFPSNPGTSSHASSPRILSQSPTQPLRPRSSGVRKSGSGSSLRSSASFERQPRRQSWRKGKSIPGLKGYQVQYIGVSGIKDRLKERTAEKRRDKIRKSIGPRYYVEPSGPMRPH